MKKLFMTALMAISTTAFTASAMAAEEWGLPDEKISRFEAKVVDVLCELTGDCPNNCGDGSRQLGLIDGSGKLILPLKNNVAFAGAVDELKGVTLQITTRLAGLAQNLMHRLQYRTNLCLSPARRPDVLELSGGVVKSLLVEIQQQKLSAHGFDLFGNLGAHVKCADYGTQRLCCANRCQSGAFQQHHLFEVIVIECSQELCRKQSTENRILPQRSLR